jgi:hypothetical protein
LFGYTACLARPGKRTFDVAQKELSTRLETYRAKFADVRVGSIAPATIGLDAIARHPQRQPRRAPATNTGLLCGEIVGVDIDVLDAALSAKLVAQALELFGPTPLLRIGRAHSKTQRFG